MNPALLIDAIVRQTTVLIAALATAAGQRATLSRVADQVFADLVHELSDQGVGHKVIADMFGMALRTYHKHVARLSASTTEHGKSLWEAVLAYVEEQGPVSRAEVLRRFAGDNDATVRGVLRDLVESRLVYQSGRAETTSYRAADAKETLARRRDPETLDRLVQVAVYRYGPVERARLGEIVPVEDELLDASLSRLVAQRSLRESRTDACSKRRATAACRSAPPTRTAIRASSRYASENMTQRRARTGSEIHIRAVAATEPPVAGHTMSARARPPVASRTCEN